jgi:hypothetical protein
MSWAVAVAWFLCRDVSAEMRLEWARTYRLDPAKANAAKKILLAKDGGVIVGGTSTSSDGDSGYTIIKYAASGDELWAKRYTVPGRNDDLLDMTVDPNGNILVTGSSDTVKYAAAGAFVWATAIGGRAVIGESKVASL